jgi:hypothetical protein
MFSRSDEVQRCHLRGFFDQRTSRHATHGASVRSRKPSILFEEVLCGAGDPVHFRLLSHFDVLPAIDPELTHSTSYPQCSTSPRLCLPRPQSSCRSGIATSGFISALGQREYNSTSFCSPKC